MATGEPKFSHITVTPDDEDDVVIQAGARPARSVAQVPVPVDEEASPTEAPEEQPVEDAPSKRAEDKGYQETTLEDLKAAPMPLVQKIVLAAAAVGVIAIVAWYLFLR